MSENPYNSTPSFPTVNSDEKTAQVMIYTAQALWWGSIIMKERVRVNMWLRTGVAPEIIHMYNARMLLQGSAGKNAPLPLKDVHIFTDDVLAYHLLPPETEPLDYDPAEPNRHFEGITAFSGAFRFEGNVILSNLHNIGRYIETTRERFLSMYEVEITYPLSPVQSPLKVPQVLVKISTAIFASK
jgi:hypothetical protein